MRGRTSLLPALGFALLSLALFSACSEAPWFVFKPKDSSFTAQFPMEPDKAVRTVKNSLGDVDTTFYTASDGQRAFTVTVAEYPEEQVTQLGPAKFLDGARDGAVANFRGKLDGEKSVDVKGHPGRDLDISAGGGKGAYHCRLILVGNKLYQLIVASPSGDSKARPVERFLESFSLS
jgi:hypothetical protein